MALIPGTRLGPYEVTALIGVGGMGEVYRATDTHLKRHVAIKVLPASVAADAERLARFQREAEVLAALNHPHIAQIYGLEKSEGITALVMELVEGDDLSQRITRGAIPIDEALPIAKQIAEALEAAHEQGIVHRDLKPANIKVRPDGTVKVLDFGLAKALDPGLGTGDPGPGDPGFVGISAAPTMTTPARMTGVGVILGTAAYMSPEQARGKPVDARTDIWAFGCVLFEMLTGTQAFSGETVSDVLGSILKLEPDWSALPASRPWPVTSLVRHCLQKDVKRRLQAIGDARYAIEEMRNMPAAAPVAMPTPQALRRPARLALAAALLALVAGTAAFVVPAWRQAPPPEDDTRFTITPPEQAGDVAVSPDGRSVVLASEQLNGLWLRRLDALDAVKLPGTEGATRPFWSPDSRSIGYLAAGQLRRVDIGGGAPQALVSSNTNNDSTGTWNADGVILFSVNNRIHRVSALGGDSGQVTDLDTSRQELSHRYPYFLPDGRHFLYFAQSAVGMSR